MGEDRGSIQQGEAGDDQVDWSIHKRQRAGRLKGPAEHWDLYTGEREPGQEDHRWEPITTATTTTVGGKNGKGSLAWPVNGGGGGGGGHATYGECQKNQCADRGTTSLDGCGEFMPAGDFALHSLSCYAFPCCKQLPFDFSLYFEGSPTAEDPKGIMPGEIHLIF